MLQERQESFELYRGYNPRFVARVMEKRAEQEIRDQIEAARKAEVRKSEIRREARIEAEAERQRKLAEMAERAAEEARTRSMLAQYHRIDVRSAESAGPAPERIRFRHTLRLIEARACKVFSLSPSELRSDRRNGHVVLARQFVMYWSARLTELSYPKIGQMLGGRDHTTCLHGARTYPEKRAKSGRKLRSVR